MRRVALCVGLTNVNPESYDGWDGYCPGCDKDIITMSNLCEAAGFNDVNILYNEHATFDNVIKTYKTTVKDLVPDDLILFDYSGHGGQKPDYNGDEEDSLDETMCWWDGQVIDDIVYQMLKLTPPGVRIFLITDSCHSETVYKVTPRSPMPRTDLQLLHFAGCADDMVSYGNIRGGYFTTALFKTFNKRLTYGEWFKKAEKKMPDQKPKINIIGKSFINKLVLT